MVDYYAGRSVRRHAAAESAAVLLGMLEQMPINIFERSRAPETVLP